MPDKALATSPRIRELTQRLEKDPASRAFLDLAKAYQAAGDHASSTRICRQGLEKHPRYHSARVLLGKLLLESKELGGAIAELGRVVGEAPENLLARRLLAEAQSEDGRRGEALESYKSLLRLQPADEEILTRIRDLEGATGERPAPTAAPVAEAEDASVAGAADEPGAKEARGPAKEAAAEAVTPSRGVETLDMRPDPGDKVEMTPPRVEARPIERPSPAPKAAAEIPSAPEVIPPTVVLDTPLLETSAPSAPPVTPMAVAPTVAFYPPEAEIPGSEDRPTQILDLADMGAERSEPPSDEEARTVMLAVPDLEQPAGVVLSAGHLASEALPTPTLADLYLEQGLPAEAEKVYLKLLEGDPGNQEIHERLARLRGGESAPGVPGSARIRIRALEGWLTRIRRGSDAAGRA